MLGLIERFTIPDFPKTYHTTLETNAINITAGTKYPEIISAILAMGAFEPWASSTSFIIFARTVSFPIAVASIFILPFLFIVAPKTLSPVFFLTGILSPVSIDSSTFVLPSITFPSTGILSPGFTRTTSPFSTSSISTRTISLFFTREAFLD